MARKLIGKNRGPGGIFDVYLDDSKGGVPQKVFVFNKRGKELGDMLRSIVDKKKESEKLE